MSRVELVIDTLAAFCTMSVICILAGCSSMDGTLPAQRQPSAASRSDAGSTVALRYIERIETFCMGLELASQRGVLREDIRHGLRVVGFERRLTVAFSVGSDTVTIYRLFYGGQNWEEVLAAAFTKIQSCLRFTMAFVRTAGWISAMPQFQWGLALTGVYLQFWRIAVYSRTTVRCQGLNSYFFDRRGHCAENSGEIVFQIPPHPHSGVPYDPPHRRVPPQACRRFCRRAGLSCSQSGAQELFPASRPLNSCGRSVPRMISPLACRWNSPTTRPTRDTITTRLMWPLCAIAGCRRWPPSWKLITSRCRNDRVLSIPAALSASAPWAGFRERR